MLRRDVLACDKRSLMTYQAASFRFRGDLGAVEVAAVRAAAESLEKQGKLKMNSAIGKVLAFVPPSMTSPGAVSKEAVESKTAEILRSCQ